MATCERSTRLSQMEIKNLFHPNTGVVLNVGLFNPEPSAVRRLSAEATLGIFELELLYGDLVIREAEGKKLEELKRKA